MSDSLEVTIADKVLRSFLENEFPKEVNQGMNRGYRRVAGNFTRVLAREKLGRKGPYRVKRKDGVTKPPRGQPTIAKKARLAGFNATLSGIQKLRGKSLSVRTSNPLLLIREFGGVIQARRKKWLAVKVKKRGRGAKGKYELRFVKQVKQAAVLGFRALWKSFQPRGREILDKELENTTKRIQRKLDRVKARRAA